MTRCYELYCVYLQNPLFCEEKSDRTVAYMNKYIKIMQEKGVKFDKSPEDKTLFLSLREPVEIGSEGAATRPDIAFRHGEPLTAQSSCTIVQSQSSESIPYECEFCHLSTNNAVEFEGHFFCKPEHADRAKASGLFKPQPSVTVKEFKPTETWEQRKAVMQPQHSRMEDSLLLKLQEKGYTPQIDTEFCTQSTRPDFYFPDKNLAIYIDGKVHEGKEDRDNTLRELLVKRHNIRVISISYDTFTEQETDRILKEILETLS